MCRRPYPSFIRRLPQPTTTTSFSTSGHGVPASFSFAQKDSDYFHVPSLSKPLSCVIEAGPVPCDLRLPLFPLASFDHMKRRSDHMEDPGARHENPNVAMGSQHMIPLSATTWCVNLKR